MASRLESTRIKLAYMLSTIYKYTTNRFKCRLPTRLQQKTKLPPTVASTTNWISRVDQSTRTRLVLQPVVQACRVTPLLTDRSQVITSLTTPACNRAVIRLISSDTPDILILYHDTPNRRRLAERSNIFTDDGSEHVSLTTERQMCSDILLMVFKAVGSSVLLDRSGVF